MSMDVSLRFLVPGPQDNKYSRGVVQLATGSTTYPGAGVLGVLGALGAGAGMARFVADKDRQTALLQQLPEAVSGAGKFQTGVIGSGWDGAQSGIAKKTALQAKDQGGSLIVDAGAMFPALSWDVLPSATVLTPHLREAAELIEELDPTSKLGSVQAVANNGEEAATFLAAATGCLVILKGATTILASGTSVLYSHVAPASWGATAGAGDVLAGVLGATTARMLALGQPESVPQALAAGIALHGRAAALAAGVVDQRGDLTGKPGKPITASALAAALPDAVASILSSGPQLFAVPGDRPTRA